MNYLKSVTLSPGGETSQGHQYHGHQHRPHLHPPGRHPRHLHLPHVSRHRGDVWWAGLFRWIIKVELFSVVSKISERNVSSNGSLVWAGDS